MSGPAQERPGAFDPATGQIHVLADRCSTCIFRPGNLMRLAPGRVRQMVTEATAEDSAIVCHSTLYGAAPPAVCRGFFDQYSTLPLRLARLLDRITYDDPPSTPQERVK